MIRARHLPEGCAVRRATPFDARRIARGMREPDRAEMEALEGCPALEVLQGWVTPHVTWMTSSPRVLTIRDEPCVIYGIAASPGRAGHAAPWLALVSTLADDDFTNVMWLSRLQVDAWQRRWPVLQTVCDVRNQFHRDWLDGLGFLRQGRVESFGAAGLPFDLYRRAHITVLH